MIREIAGFHLSGSDGMLLTLVKGNNLTVSLGQQDLVHLLWEADGLQRSDPEGQWDARNEEGEYIKSGDDKKKKLLRWTIDKEDLRPAT